jgi:hypothetical protein
MNKNEMRAPSGKRDAPRRLGLTRSSQHKKRKRRTQPRRNMFLRIHRHRLWAHRYCSTLYLHGPAETIYLGLFDDFDEHKLKARVREFALLGVRVRGPGSRRFNRQTDCRSRQTTLAY